MPQPTNTTPQLNLHPTLHNERLNVKAFDAVGDGVADDTPAFNAAIAALGGTGKQGSIHVPSGSYKLTSTVLLDGDSKGVKITGAGGLNPVGGLHGTLIFGNFTGPLFQRSTTNLNEAFISFRGLALSNQHATGVCIDLSRITAPSTISECYLIGYRGVIFRQNIFNGSVINCQLQGGGLGIAAGGWGIYTAGHTNMFSLDVAGFEHGIRGSGQGIAIVGGRYEVNKTGIMLGQDISGTNTFTSRWAIQGLSLEANDKGIHLQNTATGVVSGIGIHGTVGSPSGGSIVAIDLNDAAEVVLEGITEVGSHSTNFIRMDRATAPLTIMSCRGLTASALVQPVDIINCRDIVGTSTGTSIGGTFGYTADISPAQLVANTDNWNPTGLSTASRIRLSTDAARDITGIVGGSDGRQLILHNVGAFNAVLKHDLTSTAANRFLCPGSADFTLTPNSTAICIYDTTSSRWRVK